MAGFFGLFDYNKPGKGVSKDQPPKSRFAYFFELVLRKFWTLVQLNLLYLLFCLPVVTTGPATAAFTYVLRNMANEQPIFLFSDFWDAFKSNWKQSLVYSILLAVVSWLVYVAFSFYTAIAGDNALLYIPVALSILLGLIIVFMNFYVYLMIVTVDLKLKAIIKNAVILALVCLKTNFFTLVGIIVIILVGWWYPPLGMVLTILLIPALVGFLICYNSYPNIKKYAIDPFVQAHEPPTGEETESLFQDEGSPKE